jgi:hypothetical protein
MPDTIGNSIATPIQIFGRAPNGVLQAVNTDGSGNISIAGTPIVAKADLLAQQATVSPTTLYTVPANAGGMYRISAYSVVTQAATTSSALPGVLVTWTDNDTNFSEFFNLSNSNSTNTVGAISTSPNGGFPSSPSTINVKPGTVIQYSTSTYASVGATPMLYAVHIKLEYLGQ